MLPFRAVTTSSEPPPASRSGIRARPGRVLVIDDELYVGLALCRVLSPEHEVIAVTKAEDALERVLAAERFDLILCDLMMPIMDGIELHRRLSETMPEQANRIVFMSGGARTARIVAFFARVPNMLLEKPMDLAVVRGLVVERAAEAWSSDLAAAHA
jgi:CheY-like chemotaxis protein